jgi:hypothetical protein
MWSRRVSTVIAYADCTHTPALVFFRKLMSPVGESNSFAAEL